ADRAAPMPLATSAPASDVVSAQQKPDKSDKPAAHAGPAKLAKQARQPRSTTPQPERRVRQPRPAPFQLTDEVRATIAHRYLDLAQPVEFDGIRTQIANELSVPKPVVKQVIQELRASRQLPSWWELQAYKGSDEELERVR